MWMSVGILGRRFLVPLSELLAVRITSSKKPDSDRYLE
jgi:hypothetical protein